MTKKTTFKGSVGIKLTEGKDLFPEVDVIKIDPDRADAYDIVQALMPSLVRIAYTHLVHDKAKYERTHTDPEDEPFEFTQSELEDRVEDVIRAICSRFEDLGSRDYNSVFAQVKKEFKEPLQGDEK